MSEDKFCRICVRKDVKMYEYNRFQLKLFYKEITGSKVSKRDCLPKWFCYECAALLHKFHEFKKKCHNGQNIFKNLLESKSTTRNNFNRYTSQLPFLQIISVHTNNSIKSYTIKHGEIKQSISEKNQKNFTEVYVDDLKIIEFNSRSNDNDEARNDKPIEQNNDDNDSDIDNDIHNDSNDSLFSTGNAENDEEFKMKADKQIKHRIRNYTEGIVNELDSDEKPNIFDEKTGHFVTDDEIEKEQTYKIDNSKIQERIKSETDIINKSNIESNLVNKFQRSVKKKFLDENHWNKITLSDEEASRRFQAKALEQKYIRADFKCTDCYRTFSQEDMMKRHVKLRHCESLGPHECRHCRMRFKWKSRLQKHLKEHYTIYKCLRCELSFPVEISAFQHDYSHNGVTWTCAHCGQGFRHSSTYYTHLRKHKSKYVCTLCGVSFVSEFGLFMHKRVKHVITEDFKEESSNTYCNVCDIKFDTLKGYEDHFAESALHVTEVSDGATSLPLKSRCTKKRVPRIATTCNICGRAFSTYAAFSKHHTHAHPDSPLLPKTKDKHNGQRLVCEVCGITLASSWSLLNHLNTHSRSHRFTCKTCGLQLSSRSVLQRHQLTHGHEKSFVCDRCHKRFNHRNGLRVHLRTHEKERASPVRKKETHVMDYFRNYGPLGNNFGYETKKL